MSTPNLRFATAGRAIFPWTPIRRLNQEEGRIVKVSGQNGTDTADILKHNRGRCLDWQPP
jgi:hypothetical protein